MGTKQGSKKKVDIEEQGRKNYVAAFFGGRPRFFFVLPSPLGSPVSTGFGVLGGRPLGRFGGGVPSTSSFFSCKSKLNVNMASGGKRKAALIVASCLLSGDGRASWAQQVVQMNPLQQTTM